MAGNPVTVQKAGAIVNIPEAGLRRGDLLLLQAGDLVPADLRLVEAVGLEVDEWELTGEIMPAAKEVGAEDILIYRGSRITRGNGKGVVVATGPETEYAAILKQPWERTRPQPPPLIRGKYLPHDIAALDILGALDVVCLDKTGVLTTQDIEVRQAHFADRIPDLVWFPAAGRVAALTGIGCALCRVSRILITDLADLVTLIQSARRIRSGVRFLAVLRALALTGMAAGCYAWVFR